MKVYLGLSLCKLYNVDLRWLRHSFSSIGQMFLVKLSYSCHHLEYICEERIRAFDDLHALEQILGGDRQQVRARNLHALTVGLILNGHSLEHLWPPFMRSSLPAGPSREPSYPRLEPDGPP